MIYVAEAVGTGLVKIGFSDAPETRVKKLGTLVPGGLKLMATFDGDLLLEKSLHHYFASRKVNGEWFEVTAKDVEKALPIAVQVLLEYREERRRSRQRVSSKKKPFVPAKKFTLSEHQQRLVSSAHRWEGKHGFLPRAADWKGVRKTDWPSYQTVYRAFGSWDDFIWICGGAPRGRGRPKKHG